MLIITGGIVMDSVLEGSERCKCLPQDLRCGYLVSVQTVSGSSEDIMGGKVGQAH